MRKLLLLCLTFGLLLAALILAPLSGATKNGTSSGRKPDGKKTTKQAPTAPSVVTAVGFGVSRPVRELAQEQKTVKDPSQVEIKDREELLEQRREQRVKVEAQSRAGLMGLLRMTCS